MHEERDGSDLETVERGTPSGLRHDRAHRFWMARRVIATASAESDVRWDCVSDRSVEVTRCQACL
eukprot:3888766-Rhodomonas_salina.7